MKKKIMALCLVACLASTAIIGGTLAYFTDNEKAENVFTVGNVDIVLTEPNWNKEEVDDVYPGEPLAKDPMVTNNGKNPCFVRIKVDGLKQFGEKGDIIFRTDYTDNKLGEDWEKYEGYYYFKGVLKVGDKTDALFDQIVMPTGLTGSEDTQPITVTAEAVQAQGARPSFAEVEKMDVPAIAEWFDTCIPALVN